MSPTAHLDRISVPHRSPASAVPPTADGGPRTRHSTSSRPERPGFLTSQPGLPVSFPARRDVSTDASPTNGGSVSFHLRGANRRARRSQVADDVDRPRGWGFVRLACALVGLYVRAASDEQPRWAVFFVAVWG